MRHWIATAACAAASALALAPGASAQIAPPGNAGVDEYLETVPGGGGNERIDRHRARPGAVDPETRRELDAMGEDGRAAAELAAAGPADSSGPRERRERDGSGGPRGEGGGVAAVVDAVGGGDRGMGAALPLILVASLLGAVLLAVARRRRAKS